MRRSIATVGSALALALCAGATAAAESAPPRLQTAELIEQPIMVPSEVPGAFGARRYMLDALVIRPSVSERLPLAIITHGTARDAADRRKFQIGSLARTGRDFARRGWVAVIVVRRGHGASEGEYEEGMTCANPDYVRSGRIATYDLTNTVAFLSRQAYVDGSRVLGIGHSTGGFSWLATSSKPPPGLAAVINFAGGHGSLRPYENCSEGQMLLAMREFGSTSRIPTLWIYSENDTYVVPDLVQRMHRAFVGAGGNAELQLVPPFEKDGHALIFWAKGSYVWTPLVDAFLRRHNLPTWSLADARTDLMPAARRNDYMRYLAATAEKAFALALDGMSNYWFYDRKTVDEAQRMALEKCEDGVRKCRIFAVNHAAVPEARR